MQIDWDVPIEMDDGAVLRADVYRPDLEGRYPVILSHGMYGKGVAFQQAYAPHWQRMVSAHPDVAAGSSNRYQAWEVVDPEKWVPHGYVCVRVDSRGAGRSPGFASPFSARETHDFYQCIEWAGTQPWSSGKVGLSGISYYAINQWQVASLNPPHLTAMIPWEGAADFYRDGTYHGGILSAFWENWHRIRFRATQYGRGKNGLTNPNTGVLACGDETLSEEQLAANRVDFGADIKAHPFDDEYHRERSADWPRVTVPFLSAGNWGGLGLHLRGNTEAFLCAASEQKWLEVHGEEHWTHYYTDYGVGLQRRFFDHFLKGEDNGWDKQPRVMLQVRHVDHFEERTEDEWPIARTRWTPRYLNAKTRGLDERPAADSTIAFRALREVVTFETPPVQEATEITGPVTAKLFVSSSTTDADLLLVLRVFGPDNEEVVFQGAVDPHTPVSQGWLRASHRHLDAQRSRPYRPYHPHDRAEPLEPGAVYELDIEIWATSIVVPQGYRVALTVSSHDYEYASSTGDWLPNFANELRGSGPYLHVDPVNRPDEIYAGTVTLHTGMEHPSHVLLPIIPPAEQGVVPRPRG